MGKGGEERLPIMFQNMNWVTGSPPPNFKGSCTGAAAGSGLGFAAEIFQKDIEILVKSRMGVTFFRLLALEFYSHPVECKVRSLHRVVRYIVVP